MNTDRPSDTAVGVALGMIACMRDPAIRQLFTAPDEPYFEWFIEEHSDAARRQLENLKSESAAPLLDFLREAAAPGAALFTVLRKLFVEREVRAALGSGASQLVVLGGGYDPLALQLQQEYPQLRCFELDHPATQDTKRRALAKHGFAAPGLSLLPQDLTVDSTEENLLAAGFRAGIKSVFVCEGVLMYLPPAKVDEIFSLVHRLGGPRSRFVFTLIDRHILDIDPHAARLKKMVQRNGEALLSACPLADIRSFLDRCGFELLTLGDREFLQTEFLRPSGIDRAVRNVEFAVCARAVKPPHHGIPNR